MSTATATRQLGDLDLEYDPQSGQIRRIYDRELAMEVIAFAPGAELEVNGAPLPLRLEDQDPEGPEPAWQSNLSATAHPFIGGAQGYNVFRQVVVGSACKPSGNHINPPQSLHLRYRLDRARVERYASPDPMSAGKRPIQAPLWLETVGTLAARTEWFGPETRMLQSALGGCGPRSHVGHEDGPVREVVPQLWNRYRTTHPGVQMIPGAVYYHPDGRWLWITAQRPSVGMHWDYQLDRQVARFEYHARLQPAEILHTPEVSLYWGRGGREEMLARLAEHFIGFEEPPEWFYHTTWFWLHWWQYRPRGYEDMIEQVKFLHGELGLTGFGLTSHDVRPGTWDCCPTGLRPSPHLGGAEGLRKLGETVRNLGGKMYVWLPFLGLAKPGTDLREDWKIRGDDGRPYESFWIGSFDMYHAVNFNHPEVQDYYLHWIRRYITEFQVDGIFWDCGGSPFPPDFSPPETRPFQRFPSESMVGAYRFLDRVMEEGRRLSPDFFMWHECMGMDLPGTGYSTHTGNDDFLIELNRYARRRLVFRSCSTYNLYGGFPTVAPKSDTAFSSPVDVETYRPMAQDPMNRWLVRFVRQHGVREAVGLAPGVSLCAGHVVVDPDRDGPREVRLPAAAGGTGEPLTNVLTSEKVEPLDRDEAGATYRLPGAAAYALD
jgi:hypothetical protein